MYDVSFFTEFNAHSDDSKYLAVTSTTLEISNNLLTLTHLIINCEKYPTLQKKLISFNFDPRVTKFELTCYAHIISL